MNLQASSTSVCCILLCALLITAATSYAAKVDGSPFGVFTKNAFLRKRLGPLKDHIEDGLMDMVDALDPGTLIADQVKSAMADAAYFDPEMNAFVVSSAMREEAGESARMEVNQSLAQLMGVDLYNAWEYHDDDAVKESWVWTPSASLTVSLVGGAITIDDDLELDYHGWRWIQGVNEHGWSDKILALEKAVVRARVWAEGYVGNFDIAVNVSGSAKFRWDGDDIWPHGGEFGGFSINLDLVIVPLN